LPTCYSVRLNLTAIRDCVADLMDASEEEPFEVLDRLIQGIK